MFTHVLPTAHSFGIPPGASFVFYYVSLQVHSDFVVAATRGAMAVIDGNIMAINPGEDSKFVNTA